MVTYKPVGVDENSEFPLRVEQRLAEMVRDTLGSTLVAGTSISITVNDPGDLITIASSGGGSGGGGASYTVDDLPTTGIVAAHRGGGGADNKFIPENTMSAYEHAVSIGCQII